MKLLVIGELCATEYIYYASIYKIVNKKVYLGKLEAEESNTIKFSLCLQKIVAYFRPRKILINDS